MKTNMIDVASLSKGELRQLLRKSRQRLEKIEEKSERAVLRSSDPRVAAIADQVRALSEETGMKRRDVFAVLAGSMRMPLGVSKR